MNTEGNLINSIKELKPKTKFKLTHIYDGNNNKQAGQKLYDIVKNEKVDVSYIGLDVQNHKWYVKRFNNK